MASLVTKEVNLAKPANVSSIEGMALRASELQLLAGASLGLNTAKRVRVTLDARSEKTLRTTIHASGSRY